MTQRAAKSTTSRPCRPAYGRVYVCGLALLVAVVMGTIWLAAGIGSSAGPSPGHLAHAGAPHDAGGGAEAEIGQGAPFVLVELFTSQGCSSCPSADRLLTALDREMRDEERPMVALSWHVDYWNRLGWVDPFSSEAATDRQRWYAKILGEKQLFTPQLVIDGRVGIVGSSEREARRLLDGADWGRRPVALALSLVGEPSSEQLGVAYDAKGPMHTGQLHIALVSRQEVTDVAAGENAGRTLESIDVVRSVTSIPVRGNEEVSGKVCFESIARIVAAAPTDFRIIGWIQCAETGHILAGTTLDIGAGSQLANANANASE
jgi:hypothetical protein